jgi:hypothetical protein
VSVSLWEHYAWGGVELVVFHGWIVVLCDGMRNEFVFKSGWESADHMRLTVLGGLRET